MTFFAGKDTSRDYAFQMMAMVDVVFIMLAFFVLASQFRQVERDFSMGYGEAESQLPRAAAGDLPSHIPVRLRSSDNGVAIRIGQASLRDNDFDGIRAKLSEINMPSIGVRIMAEAQLSVGQVAMALDAVLSSPMRNVSICELAPTAAIAKRDAGD